MVRQRPRLGTPLGVDGPWLKAILDVLGDLHDLLDSRLPEPAPDGGEQVPVNEPAPQDKPSTAVPIQEPAPVGPPERDDEDEEEEAGPVEVTEPAPDPTPLPPPPPPRAGRGSSEQAWRSYAALVGVEVPDGAGRDDIIAACERAGVIEPKEQ